MDGKPTSLLRPLWQAVAEVLALLIWLVLWLAWLMLRASFVVVVDVPIWLYLTYVRLRHGKDAADTLRRSGADSEQAGREWADRAKARLAERVGWPSDDEDAVAP